jgi:hypothetical protein
MESWKPMVAETGKRAAVCLRISTPSLNAASRRTSAIAHSGLSLKQRSATSVSPEAVAQAPTDRRY